ncbi:CHAT domain-containing protein [Vararia minispora EC-137]|uniref:CHAT domain-containing protein n=1 Tax=Vararia minispora EC-137 TaxID=1314806 RepID=A0ACB8QA26_9AGAM|nr:CHAT domain-containing protein [Vararia minispora EC-137]
MQTTVLAALSRYAVNPRWRFRPEQPSHDLDVEDIIAAQRRAVESTFDSDPNKPTLLNDFGLSLKLRFDRLGNLQDLEDAIAAQRRAEELMLDCHPFKPSLLSNLGSSLRSRFQRLGRLQDLENAVTIQRRAVDLTPDGHPSKSNRLSHLGLSLRLRFQRFGDLHDVDDAISAQRHAAIITPNTHPYKPIQLNNLGLSLRSRFERLYNVQDLEDAITAQRLAVELIPDGHLNKPACLDSLGGSLSVRFKRFGNLQDLEQAISTKHRAVVLTPDSHPIKPGWLNNLGLSLRWRFDCLGDPQDLDSAVTAQRRASELMPDDCPDKPICLNNLGGSLRLRFERVGDPQDAEDAISVQNRAVDLTPQGHANRPLYLIDLGLSLKSKLRQSPSRSQFVSAYNAFMGAAQPMAGPPIIRLRAALVGSNMCAEYPQFDCYRDMALRACQSMLESIPALIWLGQSISHRLEQLSGYGIGPAITAAASLAISAGKLSLALEWLEEGRAIVWGQLTQLRDPLDDLRVCHPGPADKLRGLSAALEGAGRRSTVTAGRSIQAVDEPNEAGLIEAGSGPRTTLEDEAREHHNLAAEYEALLAQIRTLEGFESFLRPKSLAQLAPACQDGPVAVINIDRERCDALVLCRPRNVVHVPLPKFSLQAAEDVRSLLVASIHGRDARLSQEERGVYQPSFRDDMRDTLKTLWVCIVEPVLSSIKSELVAPASGGLPHITWCATGPLSSLPLHAAGIYNETEPSAPKAPDLVVSSYTPSLSVLLAAHLKPRDPSSATEVRILAVSQPKTPGQSPLPCTVAEANVVVRHFPECTTHLSDKEATVDTVFDAMAQHDWVHLACHGAQDARSPTSSAFYLHDGMLALARLMSLSQQRAGLAVLSACQTAKGDQQLPEETMHLAAGMLSAGYRSIIATMWSIVDADGPVLADTLYAELKHNLGVGDGLRVAYALHEAVVELRREVGEENFVRWVPFVHFGV